MLNEKAVTFNYPQLKCLSLLVMVYMCIMLCNAILTNKWISIGNSFVFGGAFVSPLLFTLGDIIAELFGYKLSKNIVMFAFVSQTLFAILIVLMISTPAPSSWHEHHSFSYVLGSILRIDISGFVAYFTSGIINVYFISRWKTLLQGKMYWLRSLTASTIAEGCYTFIAIFMIGFGSLPFSIMLKVIFLTYLIKIIYSIIFAYPGAILVAYLKKTFQIDIYDFHPTFDSLKNLSLKPRAN